MKSALEVLPGLGVRDVLDILVVSMLLYIVFVALQRTRTVFLIVGFLVLGVAYIAALAIGLRLTTFLFQVTFAVILLGLIVLFHAEIRVSMERLFSWRLGHLKRALRRKHTVPDIVQIIVTSLVDLAKGRIGALVVVRVRDDPEHFVHGGHALDGTASEALLKSIFDPHSIGHDGAVIVDGDRIARFGCHLPLSSDTRKLKDRGTRHAAALGMSARSDALCIVVSEERGVISIAEGGELRAVGDPAELSSRLTTLYNQVAPERRTPFWRDLTVKHWRLKVAAVFVATLLWYLIVHESALEYHSYNVPIEPVGLASGLAVSRVDPTAAKIIVSGPRRSFYFMTESRFRLVANVLDRGSGDHLITLTATDVSLPDGLTFVNIVPRTISVVIDQGRPQPP